MAQIETLLMAARVAAVVNVVLLVALLVLWGRLYREIRSRFTLGSLVFGSFLLAENLVALWFYFTAPAMPGIAVEVMMLLQILETFGIGTLLYITWQ